MFLNFIALTENKPSLVFGDVTQNENGVFSTKSYNYFYRFSKLNYSYDSLITSEFFFMLNFALNNWYFVYCIRSFKNYDLSLNSLSIIKYIDFKFYDISVVFNKLIYSNTYFN